MLAPGDQGRQGMSSEVKKGSPLKKVVAASMIGTTIEWYDFFLFGTAAALVFPQLFFPESDRLTGTLYAFATYAVGFLARPLGGAIFGHYGDRIGRKQLLMISLGLMGVSTFAIGLLPTYGQLGFGAAALLVTLRLIQGFAVGGEWGGAVLLVAEYSEPKSRGFWASWPQAGVPAGNLLSAGVMAILAAVQSDADFLAWGWRIPFLLSAVLIVIGYWIRVSIEESPVFTEAKASHDAAGEPSPVFTVIKERPGGLAIGGGLRVGENIGYYVVTAFSLTYITNAGLPKSLALNALLAGAAVECLVIPLFGRLSDKIGRRPVYAFGAMGLAAWSFAFFPLIDSAEPAAVYTAMIVGLIFHGAMYGPQAAFISELFSTRSRFSGASLAYQVTSIFAGSLAPIIAIALLQRTGSSVPVSIYMALACAISVFAALKARETRGESFAEIDARHDPARRRQA